MNPVAETIDLLQLQIRLTTSPAFTFQKGNGIREATVLKTGNERNGFDFEAEALLPFPELNSVLTAYLRGTRLEISEGLIKQAVIIDHCSLHSQQGALVIAVTFSGSYTGSAYFKGKPVYDPQSQTMALQNMSYDLKTENMLLKGLKWLFHKLILAEIKKYTVVDVVPYRVKVSEAVTKLLNPQTTEGIQVAGTVKNLDVSGIEAQENGLCIGLQCSGELFITLPKLRL